MENVLKSLFTLKKSTISQNDKYNTQKSNWMVDNSLNHSNYQQIDKLEYKPIYKKSINKQFLYTKKNTFSGQSQGIFSLPFCACIPNETINNDTSIPTTVYMDVVNSTSSTMNKDLNNESSLNNTKNHSKEYFNNINNELMQENVNEINDSSSVVVNYSEDKIDKSSLINIRRYFLKLKAFCYRNKDQLTLTNLPKTTHYSQEYINFRNNELMCGIDLIESETNAKEIPTQTKPIVVHSLSPVTIKNENILTDWEIIENVSDGLTQKIKND